MKKPVVFDLGNVVLYFDIRKAAARMAPHTAAPLEQILDTLWTSSHGIAFEEGRLGTLRVGKEADCVLLSANPLTAAPAAIPKIEVRGVWIGGRLEYGSIP